ncbi:MAG: ABC transporter ATP-binding protein [Deferribacteres bacterium]|nr:ABC transporter ATP-binding protein [candidate division KSB1 bacterium]MCB9504395.1 ABC transporter ATP-binding protein [Deferribacteres bacterium]
MIEVSNLVKSYGKAEALKGISFSVKPGEILGFLGPNGAGKSTTIKILTGLLPPSSGQAMVCGYSISTEPMEVKKRFGYIPESGALFESLTAFEYLQLVSDLHHLPEDLFAKRLEEFLHLFGLDKQRHQRLSDFSKGMKQKVLIVASLLHDPDVLFFDEPLNGVDANTALVFKEILKKMSSQGKTIFFCSHILEVVEKLCTRIIIINDGEIVTEGTPRSIAEKTGFSSLELAFNSLTGGADAGEKAIEFLSAFRGEKK